MVFDYFLIRIFLPYNKIYKNYLIYILYLMTKTCTVPFLPVSIIELVCFSKNINGNL